MTKRKDESKKITSQVADNRKLSPLNLKSDHKDFFDGEKSHLVAESYCKWVLQIKGKSNNHRFSISNDQIIIDVIQVQHTAGWHRGLRTR